jgi:hypothetical protein
MVTPGTAQNMRDALAKTEMSNVHPRTVTDFKTGNSTNAGGLNNQQNPLNPKQLNSDNLSDEISGIKLGQLLGQVESSGNDQQLILRGQKSGEQLSKGIGSRHENLSELQSRQNTTNVMDISTYLNINEQRVATGSEQMREKLIISGIEQQAG